MIAVCDKQLEGFKFVLPVCLCQAVCGIVFFIATKSEPEEKRNRCYKAKVFNISEDCLASNLFRTKNKFRVNTPPVTRQSVPLQLIPMRLRLAIGP
jgi:hypothetical protein